MQRKQAGFTLIELAISVCVLAICAGIALPSFGDVIQRHRASAATESLMTHMSLARTTAITYGQTAVLCPAISEASCAPGTDWSGGWMLFLDRNGNRVKDPEDDTVRIDLAPTSRHLAVSSTTGRAQLRYLPDGRSAGTNLTISICNQQQELLGQVIVNNMGRPRSERPKTATACPP